MYGSCNYVCTPDCIVSIAFIYHLHMPDVDPVVLSRRPIPRNLELMISPSITSEAGFLST